MSRRQSTRFYVACISCLLLRGPRRIIAMRRNKWGRFTREATHRSSMACSLLQVASGVTPNENQPMLLNGILHIHDAVAWRNHTCHALPHAAATLCHFSRIVLLRQLLVQGFE